MVGDNSHNNISQGFDISRYSRAIISTSFNPNDLPPATKIVERCGEFETDFDWEAIRKSIYDHYHNKI